MTEKYVMNEYELNRLENERQGYRLDTDYVNDDGVLCCGNCDGKKEDWYNGKYNHGYIICSCEQERQRQQEEADKIAARVEHLQWVCFGNDKRLYEHTFENDDAQDPVMQKIKRYADNGNKAYSENIGLLLWGNTGNGKTYAAACIANSWIKEFASKHKVRDNYV